MNAEPLITEAVVRAALTELRAGAHPSGRAPSVLALARRLGMPNTTLRRQFPAICAEVAAARRHHAPTEPAADMPAPPHHNAYDTVVAANARLRASTQQLGEHLELAIANIQRLTLDNHQLRQALHEARNVQPLHTHRARQAPR